VFRCDRYLGLVDPQPMETSAPPEQPKWKQGAGTLAHHSTSSLHLHALFSSSSDSRANKQIFFRPKVAAKVASGALELCLGLQPPLQEKLDVFFFEEMEKLDVIKRKEKRLYAARMSFSLTSPSSSISRIWISWLGLVKCRNLFLLR
jgi:hypothetical protein